jgi:maltose O-acetyltransferase
MNVAPDAHIEAGTSFLKFNTRLGDRVYVGPGCYFEDHSLVTLEDDVWVGPRAMFLTASHELGPPKKRAGGWWTKPILVGRGTWVGGGATILPGVRIGTGCIIAAGALVRADVPADLLVAGVPARPIRELPSSP